MRGCRLRIVAALILGLLAAAILDPLAPAQAKPPAQPPDLPGTAAPHTAHTGASYTARWIAGLPDAMVWAIAFDPQGRPWVGTHGGAAVFEEDTWQWLTEADGLGGEDANAFLFTPDGRTWIGTDRSIDVYAGGEKVAAYTWEDGLAASSAEDLALDAGGNVWAAHLAEGASRFDGERWRKFTTQDGLVDNWVYDIELDAEGSLWFATLGGVSRYDGTAWTSYTTDDGLPDAWVADAAVAPDGRLWFATHAGVGEFDRVSWTTHLAGRHVDAIAVASDGIVWAAGRGFVSFYDGAAWHDVQNDLFADQSLTTLAPAHNGDVWVGGFTDGATILAPAQIETDALPPDTTLWLGTPAGVTTLGEGRQQRFGVDDGLTAPDVRAILIDSQGRKWFGTTGGASMYDGVGWTSYFPSNASISSNYVQRVAVDPLGRTWFAYGDHGLGVSVKDGESWQQYTAADGLGSDRVYSIAFGRRGEIWLGTARGVSQWNGKRWTDLSAAIDAPAGKIDALAVSPAGYLWAGFAGGVARYDGRRWTTYGADAGLPAGAFRAIAFDHTGRIWAGAAPEPADAANGGLFVYENNAWRPIAANRTQRGAGGPAPMPLGDWISDLAVDTEGQVWVGALSYPLAKPGFVVGGVSVRRPDAPDADLPAADAQATPAPDKPWTVYTSGSGLLSDDVTAFVVDTLGRRWVGTPRGLSMFDGATWTHYTTAAGLPDDHVTDLAAAAEGGVWVATDGGGAVLIQADNWIYVLTMGLADRRVNAIAEDRDGNIWFATDGGVSRFGGDGWEVYTTRNGLADNYSRAVVVDGAGTIWVGGGDRTYDGTGLSRFTDAGWVTNTLRANLPYANVSALAVDGGGNAWAVGYNPQQFSVGSALFRYDGTTWAPAGGRGPLSDDYVYALAIGEDGRMWFGTDGSYDGRTLVDWNGANWRAHVVGETPAAVRALALAGIGGGWLGTDLGLVQFRSNGEEGDAGLSFTFQPSLRKISVQAIAIEQAKTQ